MIAIRRTVSVAAVAAALSFGAISAAQAGTEYDKGHTGYQPKQSYAMPQMKSGGGIPVVTNNSVTANNIAAGTKNQAHQGVFADQSGAPLWKGGTTTNSITAGNLAAGEHNIATQQLMARQGSGGGTTQNRVDAQNLAAGFGNFAGQTLMTNQR